MSDFTPGAFIEVAHPFVLEEYSGFDEGGPFKRMSWRPGVRFEMIGPEDSGSFADGTGKQVLTIISTHKPGRYPERVFYTRQWISPDGHQFGKTKLRITTAGAFKAIIKGYRHRYEMSPCQPALQVAI